MEKSYVGMLHDLCPVCGTKNGETSILLDRRLKESLEKDNYQMGSLCSSCKIQHDKGYIALVEIDNSNTTDRLKQEDVIRTGRIIHLRKSVFEDMFDTKANTPLVFVDIECVNKLISIIPKESE